MKILAVVCLVPLLLVISECRATRKSNKVGAPLRDEYNPCDGDEFYPDPKDCNMFYHCDGHRASHKHCPGILHWDVRENRCEWPDVADCHADSGEETTEAPDDTTTTTTVTTTTPFNPCQGKKFYPDLEDCTKYYRCNGNVPTSKTCPEETKFDVVSSSCQPSDTAQCASSEDPTTTTEGPTETPASSEVTTTAPAQPTPCPYNPCNGLPFYPDPNDCGHYYRCNGTASQHEACPNGTEWDAISDQCDAPEIAQCSSEQATTSSEPVASTSEATTDNSSSSEEYSSTTENPSSTTDDGSGSGSGEGDVTTDDGSGSGEFTEPFTEVTTAEGSGSGSGEGDITEQSTDVTSPDASTGGQSETTEAPTSSPQSQSCNPCKGEPFYPFPDDCTRYYHCDGIYPQLKVCPAALYWNNELRICDWPEFSGCVVAPA